MPWCSITPSTTSGSRRLKRYANDTTCRCCAFKLQSRNWYPKTVLPRPRSFVPAFATPAAENGDDLLAMLMRQCLVRDNPPVNGVHCSHEASRRCQENMSTPWSSCHAEKDCFVASSPSYSM